MNASQGPTELLASPYAARQPYVARPPSPPKYVGSTSLSESGNFSVASAPPVATLAPNRVITNTVTTPLTGSVTYSSNPAPTVPFVVPTTPYVVDNVVVPPPTLYTYGSTPKPIMVEPHYVAPSDHLLKRCVCEFFGTLVFFFVVALCANAFYIAAFYVALIYAFWFISGAHLNPAISFALVICRKMPVGAFFAYVIAQIAGGSLGGILFKYVLAGTKKDMADGLLNYLIDGSTSPAKGYKFSDAICIEMVYTTMLTFVALNVMCTQRNDRGQFFGIALGFVILAGGFAAHTELAGALFNPAVAFGLMTSSFKIGDSFWYILAEFGSAIIGAILFKFCRWHDSRVDHDIFHEIEQGLSPRMSGNDFHFADISLTIRMFSEFLGAFFLVFTFILNTAMDNGYAAWSAAGVLVSMIYALSDVSGGHFNPAVTLAAVAGGHSKVSVKDGVCYVIAQLVSAIPAGMIAKVISKETGLYALKSKDGWFEIGFAEFLFTMILAYVALVVMNAHSEMYTQSRPNFYYALAIGFIFLGASNAISSITGGYLNPAVALGFLVDTCDIKSVAKVTGWPSFVDWILRIFAIIFKGIAYFARVFYYWFPEVVGAIFAAFLFRATQSRAPETKTVY